jgi:uncharacterized RDD family membrane protein YckC
MERVGYLPRFFASIIDALIYISIVVFLLWILGVTQGPELAAILKKENKNINLIVAFSLILISVLPLMIDILTEIFLAGSPGKLILGLQICRSDGGNATSLRLLLRCMLKKSPFSALLISSPFLLLGLGLWGINPKIAYLLISPSLMLLGVGCLLETAICFGFFLIFSSSRMALHDILAGTAVFYKHDLQYQDLPSSPSPISPSRFDLNRAKNSRAVNELIFKKRG